MREKAVLTKSGGFFSPFLITSELGGFFVFSRSHARVRGLFSQQCWQYSTKRICNKVRGLFHSLGAMPELGCFSERCAGSFSLSRFFLSKLEGFFISLGVVPEVRGFLVSIVNNASIVEFVTKLGGFFFFSGSHARVRGLFW